MFDRDTIIGCIIILIGLLAGAGIGIYLLRRRNIKRALLRAKQVRNNTRTKLQPPTPRERELIDEFRRDIALLPIEHPSPHTSAAERKWIQRKNEFRELVLNNDPREFSDWQLIYNNMQTDRALVKEHILYLRRFANIDDLNIIEFGAGFGDLCRQFYEEGFTGTYTIFDLPEFLLLQKFYLKLHGVNTERVRFISNPSDLQKTKGFVIALWSMSEVGEQLREQFLSYVEPQGFLIGYQPEFGGINNNTYFKKLREEYTHLTWITVPTIRFKKNHYLFGFPADRAITPTSPSQK